MPGRSSVPNLPPVAPRTTVSVKFDVKGFKAFLQDQKDTNACGTTSLAMLLSFWKGTPRAYTHEQIDQSIRGYDLPTSPLNVVPYLRKQGFRAEAFNNSTTASLRHFIDQGVPVQVLYDPNGNDKDKYLHYVDVVGYRSDAKGALESVQIADPAGGKLVNVPIAEFERRWDHLRAKNLPTGFNNVMIVALPKSGQVVGRDGVVRNAKDIQLPRGGGFGVIPHAIDFAADLGNAASKVTSRVRSWLK